MSGLFKEEVLDETLLQIKVTDTDKASKTDVFVLKLLSALVGTALGVATKGLSNFLGAIAGVGVEEVKSGIPKS